jgi:hypothetical protein
MRGATVTTLAEAARKARGVPLVASGDTPERGRSAGAALDLIRQSSHTELTLLDGLRQPTGLRKVGRWGVLKANVVGPPWRAAWAENAARPRRLPLPFARYSASKSCRVTGSAWSIHSSITTRTRRIG